MKRPSKLVAVLVLLNVVLAGTAVGTFAYFWKQVRMGAAEETERRRLQIAHMDARHADIVFVGDSLIEEGFWSYWFPDADIANVGIRGTRVANVFYQRGHITRARPEKIFLMVGINDMLRSSLRVKRDEITGFYVGLLDNLAIESPQAEIFVHSVLPTNDPFPRRFSTDDLAFLNDVIKREADARGLVFVDLASAVSTPDGFLDPAVTDDGLHLNAEGYRRWAAMIRPHVEAP